jgi:hypothetical protein
VTILYGSLSNNSTVTINSGASLSANGSITASNVVIARGTFAPLGNNSLAVNGNMNFSTAGSAYLWNLSNNIVASPGINFTAPLQLNGTLSVTTGAIFDMNFAGAVNYTDSFWTNNQSWTVMNGENVSAGTNFSTAFAPGSITTGFLASEFSFITNGSSLQLLYTAPATFIQTNDNETNVTVSPGVNNVVTQDGTGTMTVAGSNANSLTIVVNNGSLNTTNSTGSLASLVNVTVNGGTFSVAGVGTNTVNNFTVNGGTTAAATNAIISVTNAFVMNGGTLNGGSYQAEDYVFTPSNTATVSAVLGNLNTNSWALIAATNGNSGTTVFNSAMTYTGGTLITDATLQLGSGSVTASVQGTITNNGVLNYGYNGDSTTPTNTVLGGGIIGQVGTGTLTLGSSGVGTNFTGSFAAANGTLQITTNSALGSSTNYYLADNGALQFTAGVITVTNAIQVTNGTGIVENSNNSTLALNGTLTKSGTVLVLAGGSFEVNGQVTGSGAPDSFNSDLVVSNATVILNNGNNNYTGPTYVVGGSDVTSRI